MAVFLNSTNPPPPLLILGVPIWEFPGSVDSLGELDDGGTDLGILVHGDGLKNGYLRPPKALPGAEVQQRLVEDQAP